MITYTNSDVVECESTTGVGVTCLKSQPFIMATLALVS